MHPNDSKPAPEVVAVVNAYSRSVDADSEARAFVAEHPEFAPDYDPNGRRNRKRNSENRRLSTHVMNSGPIAEGVGMVPDLSQRHSKRDKLGLTRFAPLYGESAFDTAADKACDELEPVVDLRDGLAEFIGCVLGSLKERHRQLLEWTYFDGLSQREIADKLGRQQSTVSRNLGSARRALEDAVAGFEGPLPVIPTGGRPRRDASAIIVQVEQALRRRGLLPSYDPFGSR